MVGVLEPGLLRGYIIDANSHGAGERITYALQGDATSTSIQDVRWDPVAAVPKLRDCSDPQEFSLLIYHFNDLHGHLMQLDPEGEEPIISRLAGEIKSARKARQGRPDSAVLVLTVGDDCSGSILDEMMGDATGFYPFHPGYRLYSRMGVDAAALGNHDFDRGLPFLAEAIRREAHFPILAANLKTCQDLSGVCHPAVILDLKGIRIGLIGLVTRAETYLDPRHCQIADPIATAQNLAPAIRPYCEVLIVLSHLGYSLKNSSVLMADAGDVELAASLPPGCVDLIIGGHSHSVLNLDGLCPENLVNGIPIVQAGANGEYFGRVEVTIRGKHAAITDARLIPTIDLPIEQSFQESEVLPLRNKLRDLKKRYLGEVDPNPELSTETIKKDFASGELALANFVTDALVTRLAQRGLNVELAMIDSSALLYGLPVGEALTFGDWFQVMPYTDTICLFILTLPQLEKLLNDNAQRLDRPGEAHLERGFLHFSRQLRYCIDPGQKRGEAVARDITMDGRPLHEHRCEFFTLAATRFIRQTAAAWEASLDRSQAKWLLNLAAHPHKETDISLRKEMIDHIVAHGGVNRAGGAQRDGRLQVLSPADPQKQA